MTGIIIITAIVAILCVSALAVAQAYNKYQEESHQRAWFERRRNGYVGSVKRR